MPSTLSAKIRVFGCLGLPASADTIAVIFFPYFFRLTCVYLVVGVASGGQKLPQGPGFEFTNSVRCPSRSAAHQKKSNICITRRGSFYALRKTLALHSEDQDGNQEERSQTP